MLFKFSYYVIILIIRLTIINYTKLYDVYIDEGQCDGGISGKKKFKKMINLTVCVKMFMLKACHCLLMLISSCLKWLKVNNQGPLTK